MFLRLGFFYLQLYLSAWEAQTLSLCSARNCWLLPFEEIAGSVLDVWPCPMHINLLSFLSSACGPRRDHAAVGGR